jgi:pantetheine-phosphate adenylyltransferase
MSDVKKALVPGTFDPITAGHLDIIERSAQIFDEIIVGVAESVDKRGGTMFTHGERVDLARNATAHLKNVSVQPFSNLLVDFAREIGALAIVKGLRVVTDFEWEFQQATLNYHLDPDMETMFIMSAPDYLYLSSSVVREIATFKGDITGLVPRMVGEVLVQRLGCKYSC